MQFTFKRDEEGRERIYVGDVCVGEWTNDGMGRVMEFMQRVDGVNYNHVVDAIERADEAGFWRINTPIVGGKYAITMATNEVTVDVPVADNAVLSVTVGSDES